MTLAVSVPCTSGPWSSLDHRELRSVGAVAVLASRHQMTSYRFVRARALALWTAW
jgi:hypothetical protein